MPTVRSAHRLAILLSLCGVLTTLQALGGEPLRSVQSPDISGDGRVDSRDLGLLLSAMDSQSTTGDLTGDGIVDAGDFIVLAQSWGQRAKVPPAVRVSPDDGSLLEVADEPAGPPPFVFTVSTELREVTGTRQNLVQSVPWSSSLAHAIGYDSGPMHYVTHYNGILSGAVRIAVTATPVDVASSVLTIRQDSQARFDYTSGSLYMFFGAMNQSAVTAYVLGPPGTPYAITIDAFAATPPGNGSAQHSTIGWSSPGWWFNWGSANNHFERVAASSNNTIQYQGYTYSRINPAPTSSASLRYYAIHGNRPAYSIQVAEDYVFRMALVNRAIAPNHPTVRWVSVDDADPRNPMMFFELDCDSCNTTVSFDGVPASLGNLGSGTYSYMPASLSGAPPGWHQIEVSAVRESSGETTSDLTTVDTRFLGTQSVEHPRPIYVPGIGPRSAILRLASDVFLRRWELPGARYDRRVTQLRTSLTSTVKSDEGGVGPPVTGCTITARQFFENYQSAPMTTPDECLCERYCSCFIVDVDMYGTAGLSYLDAYFTVFQPAPGGGAPWVIYGPRINMVIN